MHEDTQIDTKLLQNKSNQFLSYKHVQWSLHVRKEVFRPNEKLDTPLAIDLIFLQIIKDFASSVCIRINDADKSMLKNFLGLFNCEFICSTLEFFMSLILPL